MKSKSLLTLLFLLFLTAGLITAYFSFRPEVPQSIANRIAINLEQELITLEQDAQEVIATIKDTTLSVSESSCPFFLFDNRRLVMWSDNEWVPPASIFNDTFSIRLIHDGNADHLVRRWDLSKGRSLVSVIPIQRSFKITNEYISHEWNKQIFPSGSMRVLEPNATIGVPVCVKGNCLFRVSFFSEEMLFHVGLKIMGIAFLCISIVFLILLIYRFLPFVSSRSPELGLGYLCILLGGLRLIMVELNFPNSLIHFELFDPQVFAASTINASLGDLLLNMLTVLALCLYVFTSFPRFKLFHKWKSNTLVSWTCSVIAGVCFLFALLFPFVTVQTIYNNSSISLSISQSLNFGPFRIIAFIAVILSGICSFLFAHAAIRLLIGDKNRFRILTSFLISVIVFVSVNEITGQIYVASLIVGSFYFMTVYLLQLYNRLRRFQYAMFAYFSVAVFYLSLTAGYATNYFSRQERIEGQFRFARNFLIDRDYLGEYLLREVSQKINRDIFVQSRMVSAFLGRDAIRQKIRQVFLPSYFNKYDVEIFLFNAAGDGMDNGMQHSFQKYIEFYDQEAFRTEYPNVYFVNNPQIDITQKYLVVVPIRKINVVIGHIVVELSLKRIIPDNVYPELLVDNRFQEFYRTEELSYGVIVSNAIQFSSGNFNYEKLFNKEWLGDPDLHTIGIHFDDFDHIGQEDENGRVAVVSTMSLTPARYFASFSFLFVAGMAVILLIIVIQGTINYTRGHNLFFSARIQLILNLAFFLPLILVSVTTLSLTSRSSQLQLDEEYRNKARSFAQQLTSDLSGLGGRETTDLSDRLSNLAQLSNLDANLYTTSGQLLTSSQPLIFEDGLISSYINPAAIHKVRNGENLFIEREKIGKLNYFVAYAALKSPLTGKLAGILGIPFFQSAYSLEKAQITILANILNIFAGIFIILLVLSYFVSRWLTFPLTFITQFLKGTSLVETNKPITWNANDEIGLMAKEYNQMLYKLSESKAELEQTQREKAWREIAQQVAHEIKNPLTPMKLTLQQLERAMQQGTPTQEKIEKSVSALLSQVDTLNDIASSFSSFAKMPEPVIKQVELVALIKRIVDLHSHSADIHLTLSIKELYIMSDEQLLGRTFSNIIINAIQANRPGVASRIDISVQKEDTMCVIKFSDNGKGMTPEVVERVFVPHFTTKKSGSGLGMAIARQGIEHMRGKIWFDTEQGKGTTFYISLPL